MTSKKMTINIIIKDIESTLVKLIHYHYKDGVGNLGVTFQNDSSYIYGNVRLKSFLNVLASSSIGEAFNQYIKGSYSYKSVGNCYGKSPLIMNNMIHYGNE